MNTTRFVVGASLLTCISLAAFGQTSVDRSFTVTANNCDGVQWSAEALARYPTIASACQAVEERDGKSFVRFEGTVKRSMDRNGQLVIDFKDGGDLTLSPPADMHVYMNGRRTPVANLGRGDELTFYVAEDRLAAQFAQAETPTSKFIIVPMVAQAEVQETESEQLAETLPATAGSLPLVAAGGLLLLATAFGLTLYRTRYRYRRR